MEYRKEKKMFIAMDGKKIKGKYDSENCVFYGTKGTPIKSLPAAFQDTVYSYIFTSHQWIYNRVHGEVRQIALDRWERLASLELYTNEHDILVDTDYEFPQLKKDFVAFIKERFNGCLTADAQRLYAVSHELPEYSMLNDDIRSYTDRIILQDRITNIPMDWVIKALFRLQLEDVAYVHNICYWVDMLTDYYRQCTAMLQTPVITKNFFTTICHTAHLYENHKMEHMNEMLRIHNDIPELYYENDIYIVRPLLTKEDFHTEAEAQQNCVERLYMERVANGMTHVVVIRKKNNPDKSLVTCEISNDMRIIQYCAQYNHIPHAGELAFKYELHCYLSSLKDKA